MRDCTKKNEKKVQRQMSDGLKNSGKDMKKTSTENAHECSWRQDED